ncbi:lithostathine-1-alpha [Aplysia californica]|uniref:Lithostathine-1-alpha n=1 Tax=Aplysia californica TaxID=6500 RepID=A0ABM0JG13_APLCA|nr:lithostathine-1-alpha [Aplysia californica]
MLIFSHDTCYIIRFWSFEKTQKEHPAREGRLEIAPSNPPIMLLSCFFLLAILATGSAISLSDCPVAIPRDKYLQVHGNSCYRFVVTDNRDYFDAEKDCERQKGMLAMVKTHEVQEYLVKELVNTYGIPDNYRVWIGLNDHAKENQFVWEDGTILNSTDYSNWAFENGPRGGWIRHDWEDCVSIDVTTHEWNDHHCSNFLWVKYEKPFVCEYRVAVPSAAPATSSAPSTEAPTSSPTTVCPPFTCQLDCGMDGYALNPSTGCSVCDCAA